MAIETIYIDVTLKRCGKVSAKDYLLFGYKGNKGIYKLRVNIKKE